MTVEVRPLGVKCNLQCTYCYQEPQRDARNIARNYDIDAIKQALVEENSPFSIFGGEPLLVPLDDLIALWTWGFQRYGRNGIQTNGTLISDAHLDAFQKYNVHVGISVDGPGDLNSARRNGSRKKTLAATSATLRAVERLVEIGRIPSLIVTLHRANADAANLPRLVKWFVELAELGIRNARLHILEVDDDAVRDEFALSDAENLTAFRTLERLERSLGKTLQFDVFGDMRKMLLADDEKATCVWRGCDAYATQAVRGVEAQGQRSNCGRTNKDGIDYVKAESGGAERYLALYHTPQEDGGCRDCRFFLVCKGQCPGTAIDGDWRNRTEHCSVWKDLFADMEARIVATGALPITLRNDLENLEHTFIRGCVRGAPPTLAELVRRSNGHTSL